MYASLPKFKYEYEINMNDPLKNMGMLNAFDSFLANFNSMCSSKLGNIYIGDVKHKTFIEVNERGTRAGAVTKVEMVPGSAQTEAKFVMLDRPFVYAIIDNSTNLPVFIGSVVNFEG